jgi:uncharacterized protein (TIGR00297 family)
VAQPKLPWQSKAVLLLVLPAVAADVVLEAHWWGVEATAVAIWTVGLSALLGLVAWGLRSATLGGALAGAGINASLMFSTATVPYLPWQTALVPVITVLVLTSIATRYGRRRKEKLGTAENRRGRNAAQVAANLGMAAIASNVAAQILFEREGWLRVASLVPTAVFVPGLAALCEAAADTVSSELGQLLGGRPRLITTLRTMDPGTDGAISFGGTLAGAFAAAIVAVAGVVAMRGDLLMLAVSWTGGIFGLLFDSLLGATLERRGWLNNDGVNFLSTLSAVAFSLALMVVLSHSAHP